jgi:hypothetical protein
MEPFICSRTAILCRLLILLFVLGPQCPGGTYGEHKLIGDAAFERAMGALTDTILRNSYLPYFLHLDSTRTGLSIPWFLKLAREDDDSLSVTYGDLNALSADHVGSPLLLYEELASPFSSVKGIVLTQRTYLEKYYAGAPDVEFALEDPVFLGMVIGDKSHFYDYRKDMVQQLSEFDITLLESLITFSSSRIYTRELYNVSLIKKYTTLHAFAIYTAQRAAQTHSARLLRFAIYINAYADHFIEDAFSAGHRVVHRSYLGSFTNNKFMHDMFGRIGLRAVNSAGDSWVSYGDGQYNRNPWRGPSAAAESVSANLQIAVRSCSISILEVFDGFRDALERARLGDDTTTILCTLRKLDGSDYQRYTSLIHMFGALRLIPIPFGGSSDRSMGEEDAALAADIHSLGVSEIPTGKTDLGFERKAFQRLGNVYRLRYLDRRDEKAGPQDLVSAVDHHKGIGMLLIYSRFGDGYDINTLDHWSLGYSLSLKGLANSFLYDESNFAHIGWADWWMDLSFTNLFLKSDNTSGIEYKIGMTHCFDFYSGNTLVAEAGLLNEFGWYKLGDGQWRWEPAIELGLLPHTIGLKIRAGVMRNPDHHRLVLGVVWDCTRLADCVVEFFDRLFLGLNTCRE